VDSTYPYGFPYPECDPPLTKDRSDIAHIRDLAVAVDAEVERLADLAEVSLISPEAAWMQRTTDLAFDSGDFLTFETVFFSNQPVGEFAILADSSFTVRDGERGFYLFTSSVHLNATGFKPQIQITVNGSTVTTGPRGFPAQAGSTRTEGEAMLRLEAGDVVQFRLLHTSTSALTVDYTYAGAVKMAKL